tara:strand:+ start:915 stop:1256 length:342 start_codon:yes stop_codon:yes gene_type:complete
MSILSNKDKGGNSSKFSWNLKVLLGLQSISDSIVNSNLSPKTKTPGVLDITNTAGSTPGTWQSFSFVCVAGTVTIGGEVFPTGSYSFSNSNGTLNSISYDASTSTDCKITFIA